MDEREVSMIYLESPSTDPTFNLALEEYAFGHLNPQEEYFMLWRNRPSVIIGKHQNAQQEVNLLYAEQHHIPVVRRLSGGNVQKVLVGREIASAPTVLMAAYPVRGLDINSSYLIYHLLNQQKEKGVAVIYVGEDLDVLLA